MKTKNRFTGRMADVIFHVQEYRSGQIAGYLSHPRRPQPVKITSVPQLLFVLEELLETESRPLEQPAASVDLGEGAVLATLRLRILFREHYTWQGVVFWEEQQTQATFLSVLELIQLLDEILND